MSYVQEYNDLLEKIHPSYHPFLITVKEIIRLTDQMFVQQIDVEYGLYPSDIEFWLKEYPDYEPAPFAVLRVENGELVEIPYHVYFKTINKQILFLLDTAIDNVQTIEDQDLDKDWWTEYLTSLKLGYGRDDWAASEKHFLSSPENNPILLTIGPIDEYHDKIKGRKKLFSAWLLVRKTNEQNKANELWNQLVAIEKTVPGTTYYGIPFKTNQKLKLFVGDLLYGGGEVSKFDSMGWSRPQNAEVFDKYGSLKAIAHNKFLEHTELISNDITIYTETWGIATSIAEEIKSFHDTNALLPLLLHEFGHTFLKSEKSLRHLEQYYPFIEETRAQANMMHLAYELEKINKIPKNAARNIFLREFFYLPYLYEGYKVLQQRDAYLYAAVMIAFVGNTYGLATISKDKILIDEEKIAEKFPEMILDLRTFLYTMSYFGTDKKELQKHKDFIFGYCEEIAAKLQLHERIK